MKGIVILTDGQVQPFNGEYPQLVDAGIRHDEGDATTVRTDRHPRVDGTPRDRASGRQRHVEPDDVSCRFIRPIESKKPCRDGRERCHRRQKRRQISAA